MKRQREIRQIRQINNSSVLRNDVRDRRRNILFRNGDVIDNQREFEIRRNIIDSYQPNYLEADPLQLRMFEPKGEAGNPIIP